MSSSKDEKDHLSKDEEAHSSGEDIRKDDLSKNYNLINDRFFQQQSINFDDIIEQVKNNTNHTNVSFKSKLPKDLNDIIQTNSSQYILKDMEDSINYKIPILLFI